MSNTQPIIEPKGKPSKPIRLGLAAAGLRIMSWLPLSWNRAFGAALGHVCWAFNGPLKHITLTNLAICYPEMDTEKRQSLGRKSLAHTGQALTESAWVWLRSPDTLFYRTHIIAGEQLFEEALASDKGLIIATPHIGNWEACNIILTRHRAMTYLYRTPRAQWLEPLIIRCRANFDAHPARLDAGGLRTVLQQLKQGHTVGVLPDQEPDPDGGVFAPLFGEPANSMTLLQKLGSRGKATVLFCVCERRKGGWLSPHRAGWNVTFLEPEPDLLHADSTVAATAMNASIERCIALNPAQYLWSYKRYSLLPSGGRRSYKSKNTG